MFLKIHPNKKKTIQGKKYDYHVKKGIYISTAYNIKLLLLN